MVLPSWAMPTTSDKPSAPSSRPTSTNGKETSQRTGAKPQGNRTPFQ
jgi:hypothetical protein